MSSRDPWLDNAKMTLVTLAVIGHGWGLLPQGATTHQVYDFLYVWHMPALVLVSGCLSRHFTWTGRRLWVVVRTLVVPYVVFEAALAWFEIQFRGTSPTDLFLTPIWPLWYLVALVAWRLVTPIVLSLPAVVAVVGAVAVSLLGGTIDWPYLNLSRLLGLFPFFVLGLVTTPGLIERVRTPSVRRWGLVLLALTFVVVRDLDSWAGTSWLYYRSYTFVGAQALDGIEARAVILLLGLGCSIAVLALVPRRDGWFTRMGAATMVIFLFHGFVQRAVDYAGFTEWAAGHPVAAPVGIVLGAVATSFVLGWRPVASRLDRVVDPVGAVEDAVRRDEPVALASR